MRRTFRRTLWCCVIVLCLLPLQAQQSGLVSRAQILLTPELESLVPQLEVDLTHGTFLPTPDRKGRYFVTDLTARQIEHIRGLGFQVDVTIENITEHYQNQSATRNILTCQEIEYDYPVPVNFARGSMGGYYTYSELLDALDLMQLLYPNLISKRAKVGAEVTHQGRSLFWVRISDNPEINEPEPEVLYTGLHHAREPMSMMQMIFYMWHLLEEYGKDPEATYLVNNTELYFIPCINPDGYIYNETIAPDGGGNWRKNMRDNDGDGEFDEEKDGVDLNRNYGYEWGYDDIGSSGNIGSEVYRGPSAFSEPETRAVKGFIEEHGFMVALNYHAFGNYFLYPWGFTEDVNPDLNIFINYGELFALDNDFEFGTSVETVGYPTNGSSDDWMYGEHGVYAMTPELGNDSHGFWPAESEIVPLSQASLKNNLALAHLPLQYAIATELNRDFFIGKQGELDIRVKRYGNGFGDMALTVMSLSQGLTIDGSIQEISIDMFEEETASVWYELDESAKGGDAFSFVLILDNGFFEYRDTVTKVLAGETLAFVEDGEALSEWVTGKPGWGMTTEEAHEGLTSFTDSPFGPSAESAETIITLSEPIDLTTATYAVLEFWAKWEIEELIDYARVLISTDGTNFEPLCGQYSKPGSVFQPQEPIYDGTQAEWVKESIDLSAYLGETVYLQFSVVTDIFFSLDGFYVDDLRVYVYDEDLTDVITPSISREQMQIWPNPTRGTFWISLTDVKDLPENSWITVTSILGEQIERQMIGDHSGLRVNATSWPSGIYLVNVFASGNILASRKVLVE